MQSKLNQFVGKIFIFSTLKYTVLEVKIVNQKAAIKTDRRTFVFLENELDDFIEAIRFLEADDSKTALAVVESSLEVQKIWSSEDDVLKTVQPSDLQVAIMVAESNAARVSNKLMEVFEELSDKPTEATYKKASAMVNMSNSIVNVQMAQIKFLSLKK